MTTQTAPTSPTCLTAGSNENPGRTRETRNQVQITHVTHLTEDGVDRRFIQVQVGHECDSSTAIYTNPRELHPMGELCLV